MMRVLPAASILLLIANAAILVRVLWGGAELPEFRPRIQHRVSLQMSADLQGDPVQIRVFLPHADALQSLSSEEVQSHLMSYSLAERDGNRAAHWRSGDARGREIAVYEAVVDIHPRRFAMPADLPMPREFPTEVLRYLTPTELIQSDAPEIRAFLEERLPPPAERRVAETIRTLFDFVQQEIRSSDYENTLDAVTTLSWGEAFCGGKSRLLVALLRAANLPARVVGGLILSPGSKRTTHVWLEAWVNGVWVPFDALNDHYAEHPDDYLVLYRGDEALFRRTKNINFQYVFNVKRWRTPPDEHLRRGGVLDPYVFWETFRKAHISLDLLRIILMLPVGVLIVVFFRNVVGLTTFGTFHPALIAVAFRDTGLAWGVVLYLSVLLLGLGLRSVLDRAQLLHTPRLALVLSFVVLFMLGVSFAAVDRGLLEPAHVSMYPIAILAITVESYFVKSVELGSARALLIMLQTLAVIAVIYAAYESFLLQILVFSFPEVLLAVAAGYLLLGRFLGMRWIEYHRFRWLLTE